MILDPVFIGGCSRSGTTLLGSLLGGHDRCVTTPESQFKTDAAEGAAEPKDTRIPDPEAAWPAIESSFRFRLWGLDPLEVRELARTRESWADAILGIVEVYARHHRRSRARYWIDHTPDNMRQAVRLSRWYPRARFVHVVRDGRAVAASVLPLDWGPNTVIRAAHWWAFKLSFGLAVERSLGSTRVMRVKFEELVEDPERVLSEVCGFVGLEYRQEMIDRERSVPAYTRAQHRLVGAPPDPSAAERWRDRLTERDVEIFEWSTGDLLPSLGYRLEFGVGARAPAWKERARMGLVELGRGRLVNPVRHAMRRRRLHHGIG